MFIQPYSSGNLTGSIQSLKNMDYYKRYIIIESPNMSISPKTEITIINISSSTGRSFLGIFKESERRQNYNIYHAHGNIFNSIPQIIGKDIGKYINPDAKILIDDVSYGVHVYDLSKRRFSELSTTTSYIDMYNDEQFDENLHMDYMPYPLFYNYEHHILNENNKNTGYPTGKQMIRRKDFGFVIDNSDEIKFSDLIDDHTHIILTQNSNFKNIIEANKPLSKLELDLEALSCLVIGPVTNLLIGLLFNELDFCYDSAISGSKISRIQYKTDHKLANNLYQQQIYGNHISVFQHDMEYIREFANMEFRLFVHCRLGNIRIRFIQYTANKGYITKDFSYDIGENKNMQHKDTMFWLKTPLF